MVKTRLRARSRTQAGFTLIELLVVIIILGVLSAVVVFAVRGTGDKGDSAASATDLKTFRTAEESFCAKFGRYGTERQLAGLDPAPDGSRVTFLSEESSIHDVELDTTFGNCGNSSYTITSPIGAGDSPLPMDQQNLTIAWAGGDPYKSQNNTAPAYDASRLARYNMNTGVCETMTKFNSDLSVGSLLATRWELINPGNNPAYPGNPTWRFHLRPNVTFHDGTPFTAADVKYSYDRLTTRGDDFSVGFGSTNATVVVNPLTIDLTPAVKNLRVPEILVHPTYGIMKNNTEPGPTYPSIPAGVTPNTVTCTGPFKFVSYTIDQDIKITRFDTYWGQKAKSKNITFRFIADATTRMAALQSTGPGSVDGTYDLPRQQVNTVKSNSSLQAVIAPPSYVWLMYQNINGTVGGAYDKLRDENVRRALALSMNRPQFATNSWPGGNASVVNTPSPPSILGANASMIQGYTQDLGQARQLLATSGWVCTGSLAPDCNANEIRQKSGVPLKLEMLNTLSPTDTATYPLLLDVQNYAKAVGINIDLTVKTAAARTTAKNSGNWDLDFATPNQNDSNPAFLLTLQWWSGSINPWVSCNAGTTPCGPWQQAGPAFDAIYAQAITAPTYEGAQSFAAQAMKYLVDDHAITIPMAGVSRVYGLKKSIAGFAPHPAQNHATWETAYRTK